MSLSRVGLAFSRPRLAFPCLRSLGVDPQRSFAKRRRRKKPIKKKKDPNHPDNWTRWRFSQYLTNKDPDVSYWDPECEGWTFQPVMILERSPRLVPENFEPSWEIEWQQFQDELDLKKKKIVPLEWLETRRQKLEEAAKVFKPNPRITDADREHNTKSLHRRMDLPTYLVVQRHGSDKWTLPTADWVQNETLRESVEKMATQQFGFDLVQYLMGNAPIAHYVKGNTKTFFFHNLWVSGNVILKDNKSLKDFAWITQEEFPEYGIEEEVVEATNRVLWAG